MEGAVRAELYEAVARVLLEREQKTAPRLKGKKSPYLSPEALHPGAKASSHGAHGQLGGSMPKMSLDGGVHGGSMDIDTQTERRHIAPDSQDQDQDQDQRGMKRLKGQSSPRGSRSLDGKRGSGGHNSPGISQRSSPYGDQDQDQDQDQDISQRSSPAIGPSSQVVSQMSQESPVLGRARSPKPKPKHKPKPKLTPKPNSNPKPKPKPKPNWMSGESYVG